MRFTKFKSLSFEGGTSAIERCIVFMASERAIQFADTSWLGACGALLAAGTGLIAVINPALKNSAKIRKRHSRN
jgi:hypothetical protein